MSRYINLIRKTVLAGFFFWMAVIGLAACGERKETEEVESWTGEDSVAVASFRDMKLPVYLEYADHYALNGKWFYLTRTEYGTESTEYQILRSEAESIFEGEVYIARESVSCLALAADRENNCYVLWKEQEGISLEKYDASGQLQWHVDHSALTGIGENLQEGIVTEDGRLVLFSAGEKGTVAVFDAEGSLQMLDTLRLEQLDGMAVGKENRIYGYCITGEGDAVLLNIEEPEQYIALPFRPLKVYGGYEEGIYLCDVEGLWKYDPETGRTERKWAWADEYMNVNVSQLDVLFCGNGEWRLLCYDHSRSLWSVGTDQVTVVAVRLESREDYGGKENITLGYVRKTANDTGYQTLEKIVRLYNRQSETYQVVLVPWGDEQKKLTDNVNAFALQLIQGEAPDLVEVSELYVGNLAEEGMLCELSAYYADVPNVGEEYILEPVWEGMQSKGKNVLVIPSFHILSQACEVPIAAQEWKPEKLIQLAEEEEKLWEDGTSYTRLFRECVGRDQEYRRYVDYEKKESHFNCEEFRWILENCARVGNEETGQAVFYYDSTKQPAFLYNYSFGDMTEYMEADETVKNCSCYWVGYPGWNGAQYRLIPDAVLAMNGKSENKDGAWDFLQFLLSEEFQNEIDWGFPAREDSFERYLENSYRSREENERMAQEYFYSTNYYEPTEEDFERVRNMVEHSILERNMFTQSQVKNILYEEVGMFFSGDASLEETLEKIDNRVRLYLNE